MFDRRPSSASGVAEHGFTRGSHILMSGYLASKMAIDLLAEAGGQPIAWIFAPAPRSMPKHRTNCVVEPGTISVIAATVCVRVISTVVISWMDINHSNGDSRVAIVARNQTQCCSMYPSCSKKKLLAVVSRGSRAGDSFLANSPSGIWRDGVMEKPCPAKFSNNFIWTVGRVRDRCGYCVRGLQVSPTCWQMLLRGDDRFRDEFPGGGRDFDARDIVPRGLRSWNLSVADPLTDRNLLRQRSFAFRRYSDRLVWKWRCWFITRVVRWVLFRGINTDEKFSCEKQVVKTSLRD